MRGEVAPAAIVWAREFWSELVNGTSSVRRLGNQGELWGWKIRLVWEDDERRGVVYLHRDEVPRQVVNPRRDLRTFVFRTFDPRAEARSLLRELRTVDAPTHRDGA